jgi:hypothetical protein
MLDIEKYIKESKDKVICVYNKIDDLNKEAEGVMYFQGHMFKFLSGRYGKGYAPIGKYRAFRLIEEEREAFKQFDLGWQTPLEAKFPTNRSGLALHPDGNKKGTLGCIGLDFESIDENVLCHNLLRDFFENKPILNVEIIKG